MLYEENISNDELKSDGWALVYLEDGIIGLRLGGSLEVSAPGGTSSVVSFSRIADKIIVTIKEVKKVPNIYGACFMPYMKCEKTFEFPARYSFSSSETDISLKDVLNSTFIHLATKEISSSCSRSTIDTVTEFFSRILDSNF